MSSEDQDREYLAAFAKEERVAGGVEARARAIGYPPALAKACVDPFQYVMILKNETQIVFESAEIVDANWVHLCGSTMPTHLGA
jgi:hypothetical protein